MNMQKLPEKLFTIQVSPFCLCVISSISLFFDLKLFLFADETYLATISVQKPMKGYPIIDKFQVADSEWNATSTGDVNFYLQKNNPVFANIKKKNEVSAMFSNETRIFNNETSEWETSGKRVFLTGFVAQVFFYFHLIFSVFA